MMMKAVLTLPQVTKAGWRQQGDDVNEEELEFSITYKLFLPLFILLFQYLGKVSVDNNWHFKKTFAETFKIYNTISSRKNNTFR